MTQEKPEEELRFVAIDEQGNCTQCETLFTFDSPRYKKSYIVYTDNTIDDDESTLVYASTYDKDDLAFTEGRPVLSLLPIETKEEWRLVEAILEEIQAADDEQ